jgi:hypothetical protein
MQQDRQKMAQKQLVSHQSDARNRTHRQKSNRRPGIATTQGVVQQPVKEGNENKAVALVSRLGIAFSDLQ